MNDAEEEFIIDQNKDPEIKDKKQETRRVSTLRPLTERMPLRMHSFRPVPRTITSYSSSMAALQLHCTTRWDPSEMNSREREKERERVKLQSRSLGGSPRKFLLKPVWTTTHCHVPIPLGLHLAGNEVYENYFPSPNELRGFWLMGSLWKNYF